MTIMSVHVTPILDILKIDAAFVLMYPVVVVDVIGRLDALINSVPNRVDSLVSDLDRDRTFPLQKLHRLRLAAGFDAVPAVKSG